MSHIAMLLPREDLVRQAQELARSHPSIREICCVQTDNAVQEAARVMKDGASIIISRGLHAILIGQALNVPVVQVRLTAQELGLLLLKAKRICTAPRPRIALVAGSNMLCDTSFCGMLFGVELAVYPYDTEEGYRAAVGQALDSRPDVLIGGEHALAAAQKAGVPALFLDYLDDSLREAIHSAETALYADEQNRRANALFDALLSSGTSGYVQLGADGRVVKINDIMLDMLGGGEKDYLGRALESVLPGIEKATIAAVLAGQNSYSTFLHIHYQPLVAILAPIRLVDGRVEGAVLSCHKVHRGIQLDAPQGQEGQRNLSGLTFDSLRHRSPAMAAAVEQAKRFSQSASPVLLTAEGGLETALLAQCIHNNSLNGAGAFVQAGCAGLDAAEQKRVLFGTGAAEKDGETDLGAFGMANNGTLFVPDLETLTPAAQESLYRVLRDRRIARQGTAQAARINVRLIAAAPEALYEAAARGTFRPELFYLLSGLQIRVPPLRERPEDLEELLQESFRRVCDQYHRYHVLTNGAWELLRRCAWPGNEVQIDAFLERMVLTAQHRTLDEVFVQELLQALYPARETAPAPAAPADSETPEARRIREALERNGGSRAATAGELGISTTTLWRRIKKLGIAGRG